MKASRCQFLKPTPTEATPAEDLKSGTDALLSCFETEKNKKQDNNNEEFDPGSG